MKNKIKAYIIAIFFAALLIVGGTFAFWTFTSNNKSVAFNTTSNLKKYINYDSGESHFSGTLVVGENYTYGIHSTISVSKSEAASKITLMGTIYMDINEIGENMRNSSALKWALTSGDSTNVGPLLAEGNFIGAPVGDSLILLPSFEVTTSVQQFTVWIWLDQSEHPSEALSGETLDTNVWVEINQVEGTTEDFIVTQINANYQIITATAVNNRHNIDGYAVTTSSTQPGTNDWTSIANPGRIYNLTYSNTQVGETYYVWFKDIEGHTTHDIVEVTQSDTTSPSCTWGTFSPNSVGNGKTATISLTCTDSDSGIVNSNITTSNITAANQKVEVTNITKAATTNGYIYTITVTGISTVDGTDSLTLAANSVRDGIGQGNASVTSGNIIISNASVVTINAGNGISSITGTGLTYNSSTRQATGTFSNGSTINLSALTITYKTGYSGTNWAKTSGEGSLSGTTFTVGAGAGELTLNAATLANPTCTISGGATKVYNYQATTLTATNSTSYDSGVTLAYQFGYTTSSTGTLGNFANGTNNTFSVGKNAFRETRYYGAKVTATGDGGLTSTCTTATSGYTTVALVNARIDFDATTNGGTISGTTPLYVGYGVTNVYTGRTNTTGGTIPTATKEGYTFNGWYTAASGGTKVINADGTVVASVANWTNASKQWLLTNAANTQNTNRLYAQYSATYTATFYYNSNATSGSTTVTSRTESCTVTNLDTTCTINIPSQVTASVGTYNNAYAGLSTSTGNMTEAIAASATTITLSASQTYYALYRTAVTIYEPTSTTTAAASTYYRNQWFTSTSAMATTVLSDSQTGTSNWEFVSKVDGWSILRGFNTAVNKTATTYTTVAQLAATNKVTAYQILSEDVLKTGTFYYNASTAGDGTVDIQTATATQRRALYCKTTTTAAATNMSYTRPAVVTNSVGPYGQPLIGTAYSTNSMSNSLTNGRVTFYAFYRDSVTNYYYDGTSYTSRTLYRNSVFTSKTATKTVLATTTTGTSDYTTETGPSGSTWAGLSTADDTTAEYATVTAAANSTSTNLYTVYSLNIIYSLGANVSSVGAASGSCEVTSGTSCSVTLPSITPNAGYTSVGWSEINGATTGIASGQSYTLSTSPVTLYANATANSYTVTADASGGTIPTTSGWTLGSGNTTATKSVTYGSAYGTLPTPTRTGYEFLGWNGKNMLNLKNRTIIESGDYSNSTVRNLNGNQAYIGLTANNYFLRNKISSYEIDDITNTIIVTSTQGAYGIGVDISVTPNTNYTISIDNNTNTKIRCGFFDSSGAFISWHDSGDKSALMTAPATANWMTIVVAPTTANTAVNCSNIQLLEGNVATGNTLPFEPYYVTSTVNVIQTQNHTLTAKWNPNTYTITLDNQGATTTGTTAIYEKYDNAVCLDSACTNVMTTSTNGITIPVKTGYTFGGYYDGTTQMIDDNGHITAAFTNAKYSANKTLTASWTANTYTVKYATGNNACELNATTYADTNATYNVDINKANPTCTGYTFAGWTASGDINTSTAKYGTAPNPSTAWVNGNKGTYFKNLTAVNNGTVTLTAGWQAQTYTVTADADGGTIPTTSGWTLGTGNTTATKSVTYASAYGTLPTPTKTGYTFLGWNGKNLFDEEKWLMAIKNATYTDDHYVFLNNQAYNKYKDANGGVPMTGFKTDTQYTFSITGYVAASYLTCGLQSSAGAASKKLQSTTESTISVTSVANGTVTHPYFSYGSSKYVYISHMQIEEGTEATAFEPYYVTNTVNVTQPKDHTLTAKWNPNTYTITLDNQSATTAGTTAIYEKYDNAVCLDSACTNVMTTSTNGITVPTKTGYIFNGYYDNDAQIIDADGHITSLFTSTRYSANHTLTASWSDTAPPTGTLTASLSGNTINASIVASDSGSGLKSQDPYGWYVDTSSTCGPSLDGSFIPSSNSSYSYSISSPGVYYICVRVTDDANNSAYFSESVEKTGIDASSISYSGTWSGAQVECGDNWYAQLTGSGTLTLTSSGDLEVFMVGGGGSGGSGQQSQYAGGGGGGSGGAIETGTIAVTATTYNIVIGAGGNYYADGSATTGFGLTAAGGGKGGHSSPSYSNASSAGVGGTVTNGASGGAGVSINQYSSYISSVAGTDGTEAFGDGTTYGTYGGGGGGGSSRTSDYINGYYGTRNSGANAPGGAGGGGSGGGVTGDGVAGTANTGGGGGGGGANHAGGAGGSGIVIIRNARDGSTPSCGDPSPSSSSGSGSGQTGQFTKTTVTCHTGSYNATLSDGTSYANEGTCNYNCNTSCVKTGSSWWCQLYSCPNGGTLFGTMCYTFWTTTEVESVSECTPYEGGGTNCTVPNNNTAQTITCSQQP